MFLHVIAVDRQLSVHTQKDKPLTRAVDEAFRFHKKQRTSDLVATAEDGRELDLAKSAEANGLADNEVVTVRPPVEEPVEEMEVEEEPTPRVRAPRPKQPKKPRPVQGKVQAWKRPGFGTTPARPSEATTAEPSAIERRMAEQKNAAVATSAPAKTTRRGKK